MKRYLAYLRYVLRHKKFVYQEGRKLGLSRWRLFWHDWDKFLPDEFIAYAECFYKSDGTSQYVESPNFARAWYKHQQRNKHHWQHWVREINHMSTAHAQHLIWDRGQADLIREDGSLLLLNVLHVYADPMPEADVREMLADWRGAGQASGNMDTRAWYKSRQAVFKRYLHHETLARVEMLL